MGFFDALATVEQEQQSDIPNHLKDNNRDKKGLGHGANYLYPHAYRDHWVEQQYLPSSLQGRVFYQPSEMGKEAEIKTNVARRREAQLAAQIEGLGVRFAEMLTYGETDKQTERWLERTINQSGKKLGDIRDRFFELAKLQRHHLILDLNAKSGLLTWEALRQVPEGGVYSCVREWAESTALNEQAAVLPELLRPVILVSSLVDLPNELAKKDKKIHFDCIIGRNCLTLEVDKARVVRELLPLLNKKGKLTLAETVPQHNQRLYNLLQSNWLSPELGEKLKQAEEAIYQDNSDPMVNWNEIDLKQDLEGVGLSVEIELELSNTSMLITPELIMRWFFNTHKMRSRLSYRSHLEQLLSVEEIDLIQEIFAKHLCHKTVSWSSTVAYFVVRLD